MSDNPVKEVLSDLFPYLESLETKCAAILAFLKEKGIATDEQLNPYLEQAADASGVRWHAARLRMEHLFAVPPEVGSRPSNNLPEKAAEGRIEKATDQKSANDNKDSSAEKTPAAKAMTKQEADGSTEKKSNQTADNSPQSAGPDIHTTAKSSEPDESKTQSDDHREKDAA
jgi:hypothetical protein